MFHRACLCVLCVWIGGLGYGVNPPKGKEGKTGHMYLSRVWVWVRVRRVRRVSELRECPEREPRRRMLARQATLVALLGRPVVALEVRSACC